MGGGEPRGECLGDAAVGWRRDELALECGRSPQEEMMPVLADHIASHVEQQTRRGGESTPLN